MTRSGNGFGDCPRVLLSFHQRSGLLVSVGAGQRPAPGLYSRPDLLMVLEGLSGIHKLDVRLVSHLTRAMIYSVRKNPSCLHQIEISAT